MKTSHRILVLIAFVAAFQTVRAAPQVFTAAGAAPADLAATVTAFRTAIALTGPGPVLTSPAATGFRNINWDGAPDSLATPNALPGDFFNGSVRRGAVFTTPTPGATVQVSATSVNADGTPTRFGNIDASYSARFKTFTAERLFAAVGSTVVDTRFFVVTSPDTTATVNGFGVVFCDVDLANVTSIECFDAADRSLGRFFAPVSDNGLSFLGVYFADGERVARVRITQGNLPPAPGNVDTATLDVVAMDDFMYSEPRPLGTDATLVNISQRARVGTGEDVSITGFVVGGTQPKTLLVRVAGPVLTTVGVAGALANPQFNLVNSTGQVIASNDDWAGREDIAQAAAQVGAFPFPAGSKDAATLVVLNPGVYSVVTSGVNGGTGVALTEVYEVK